MNPIVLIVAGVFVVAGLALIVLSFVVGRSSSTVEEEPVESEGVFIDRPLARDMGQDLGVDAGEPPVRGSAAAAPTPSDSSLSSEASTAASAEGTDETTLEMPVLPPRGDAAVAAAAGASAAALAGGAEAGRATLPDAEAVARKVQASGVAGGVAPGRSEYEFRVQLGFSFLQNGQYREGVEEFQRAVGMTDDDTAKLNLYVEIGNVFRSQEMYVQAMAAYSQATEYARDPLLREHLERTMAEMAGGGR